MSAATRGSFAEPAAKAALDSTSVMLKSIAVRSKSVLIYTMDQEVSWAFSNFLVQSRGFMISIHVSNFFKLIYTMSLARCEHQSCPCVPFQTVLSVRVTALSQQLSRSCTGRMMVLPPARGQPTTQPRGLSDSSATAKSSSHPTPSSGGPMQ